MYELTKWFPTWEENSDANHDIPLRIREELLSRDDFRTLLIASRRFGVAVAESLMTFEKRAQRNTPHFTHDTPQCAESMTRWLAAVIGVILPNLQTLGYNEGSLQGLAAVKNHLLRSSTSVVTPIKALPREC